jgi:hypothetical protein
VTSPLTRRLDDGIPVILPVAKLLLLTPCQEQGSVGLVSRFGQFYKAVDPGLVRVNVCTESVRVVGKCGSNDLGFPGCRSPLSRPHPLLRTRDHYVLVVKTMTGPGHPPLALPYGSTAVTQVSPSPSPSR